MANGRFILGKQSGGTLGLVFPDGIGNTEVLLPESGNLASVGTEVTDNAIARYDGTTGKLQNSSVIIDDGGNLLLKSGTGALGYGTGAGGQVTQLTSRSTAVTLNKPSGTIYTHNESLANGASVNFVVYNNLVTIADLVYVYGGAYSNDIQITADNTTDENGKFNIRITNNSGYTVPYSLPINFVIIKGARA